jgi:endonuclease/exonuclease/phosphatase family metal-dependent hydrolase
MLLRTPISSVLALSALVSVTLLAGCDDDEAAIPATGKVTIATYNAGLAYGFVDYASQRKPALEGIIEALDVDVLCLQEVWTEEDLGMMAAAGARGTLPNSYFEYIQDTTVGPPSCTTAEAEPLLTCAQTNCGETPANELSTCVIDNCIAEFAATTPACQGCLAANLGSELSEILTACTTSSAKFNYGGANGVLLLSKHPITAKAHATLSSSLVQRSVLMATIDLPAFGETDVACTHLAADLSNLITYNGDFGSFGGEQAAQTNELIAFLEANGTARTQIVTGDFNSGPAVDASGIVAELPEAAYGLLLGAGFSVYQDPTDSPACTYCADNALIDDAANPALIDHVFVRGLPSGTATIQSSLIGTQGITIQDDSAMDVATHPSDHYGVRVEFDYGE